MKNARSLLAIPLIAVMGASVGCGGSNNSFFSAPDAQADGRAGGEGGTVDGGGLDIKLHTANKIDLLFIYFIQNLLMGLAEPHD